MIKPIVVCLKRVKSLEGEQTNLSKGLQNLIDTKEKKWPKAESGTTLISWTKKTPNC